LLDEVRERLESYAAVLAAQMVVELFQAWQQGSGGCRFLNQGSAFDQGREGNQLAF
jgi:hypothetical protein